MRTCGAVIVETGASGSTVIPLWKQRMVIGSHPGCDIVVGQRYVSRNHAALTVSDGSIFIEDLGSKNGTLVDGETVGHDPVVLDTEAEVQLADGFVRIRVVASADTETFGSIANGRSRIPEVSLDPGSQTVRVGAKTIEPGLSAKQFDLLHAMFRRAGKLADYEYLKSHGWPDENQQAVTTTALRTQIGRVRRALRDFTHGALEIRSVRDRGYVLYVNE